MAAYEWDNSIAIGIPAIDAQHKELFGWLNTLEKAIEDGDDQEAVSEVIWNLVGYVSEHFSAEERMMQAAGYPQLNGHREEHDLFVERLQSIQTGFAGGQQLSRSILDFLGEWLVRHIKGTDQELSRFLHRGA